MSLTILVHAKSRSVGVVRWYLDPKVSISYASGPVAEMSWEQFRAEGYDFVHRHFEEFTKIRICEKDVVPPFDQKQAKRYMEDRDVVEIKSQVGSDVGFLPCVVRRYNLGGGIEVLGREKRRTIPANSPPEVFWSTFDDVLAFSHEYSV